ncbi:Spc7-domain-containing protein [Xylariomycetidae sp. FL2044]|nr:Spc7-domain-containing protein [Xylariomycetidae sp. FL2044]
MSTRTEATVPPSRRPRKSTGHSPVRKRMEKENITVDLASSLAGNGGRKKSRSKSMGPGGLDILKSASGNRRVSLAAPARPPPRSILKPTIPHISEIPPHKPKSSTRKSPPSAVQGTENLPNPFQNEDAASSGTKIALRTEEEQQAAAREREERERAQLEKEINDRREARRKSLANRRVSFAAEATLHTFHEIEFMQDSTTSTESTRRASSLAAQSPAPPALSTEASDPPSTPPEQVEEVVPASPDDQRDLHQRKRRRSSGASSLHYNHRDDETFASSVYSSDSEGADGVIEQEDIGSDSGSDSDADGVSMDLDIDEMTGTSVASGVSARSAYTAGSNDTLDDALRLATRRAETQRFDEDEEIIPSFGWAKKPTPKVPSPTGDPENSLIAHTGGPSESAQDEDEDDGMEMDMNMDITNAVGGILGSNPSPEDDGPEEEMSMDVTKVFGGILPQRNGEINVPAVPATAEESSSTEDTTMDLTMAIGKIRNAPQVDESIADFDNNEDMSMELTTIMGGVLPAKTNPTKRTALPSRRRTIAGDDEATMDMTVGLGRILTASQNDDNEEDDTRGMEMTAALGGIVGQPSPAKNRTEAKQVMEQEADMGESVSALKSPPKRLFPEVTARSATSETGSPGLSVFRGNGLRRSKVRRLSTNSANSANSSPLRSPLKSQGSSPSRTRTPDKRQSQSKTSPLRTLQRHSVSPRRQDPNASVSTPISAAKSPQRSSLFHQDPFTGATTPQVLLTPQPRRLSGVGADRPGLGSPKVTAIFDRRGSIGEAAKEFTPREASKCVSFANPRAMEDEVDRDRQQEEDRENGRKVLEREADGGEDDTTTTTLKDMISSMTPKKNHVKGRKSLHVGSAKGLLGKRPAELDEDEESELRDGVKRLKGLQSSPVKNVRLHAPPSKAETTGRATRSVVKSPESATINSITPTTRLSPSKGPRLASSPHGQGRFKDVEADEPTPKVDFERTATLEDPASPENEDGDQVHLQDFLSLINVRFMELTTTKRRHTQARTSQRDSIVSNKDDVSLERCVVAGACTVPMLELYQHSCRELKKYISEGRRIVREIETETLEENPPLFQEYMCATPEFKTLMDNQFKNVKTHARLLSKAMWYEWRTKLQDGLKEGLLKIAEGMTEDEQLLYQEQQLLDAVIPMLVKQSESLGKEHENLTAIAHELADCDPEDLQAAREELQDVDMDVRAKMKQIEELQQQLKGTEASISDTVQRKHECVNEIEEAERVREECRGWSSKEISSLKAKVEEIERQHGWSITGIVDATISMAYRGEIELVFDTSSFQGQGAKLKSTSANSRIDLWYIAANRKQNPQPATPEKEFFIQCIRDHVRGLVLSQTKISRLLHMVSDAWQRAAHVTDNLHLLNCTFPTNVVKTSDSSIAVRITMLLSQLQTKLELTLALHDRSNHDGVGVAIVPQARVVYGEQFKIDKIAEYLATRIGTQVLTNKELNEVESWSDVVVELHERLLARGKK